jgi:uncharacterized protein YqjF (DUF2071 family)
MQLSLKNHPFAVQAYFERSVVLTFAVLKEQLQNLIPECLTLDAYDDKYAFIAIAIVNTTCLRPKGLPQLLGNKFNLIGYRIFVRYKNNAGKNLRGLYIIKSETDKLKMRLLGNIFTQYKYTITDITQTEKDDLESIRSVKSGLEVIFKENTDGTLPSTSPFKNLKEARRYAGPLPFTFTYDKEKKEVLIIEGVRENWTPAPLDVILYKTNIFDQLNVKNKVLANAFIIKNVPYYWKKGVIEKWMH